MDAHETEHPDRSDGPQPEPIRFYGTTWVDHSRGYALRRAGLTLGALLLAAAGAYVLRLAWQGFALSGTGGWTALLVVLAFAVCSALAFARTLGSYTRPDEGPTSADSSLRSVKAVGFIGVLVAYALRSLVEAPGEKLLRAEYEQRLDRHAKRRNRRSGNPAGRKHPRKK